jgi:hypothetical protein
MPTFGPGPGQYQSQTTFNPALQPTVQVEQQQSLFAQIAGLVPVAAEAAAGVINYGTKLKEQQYAEEEAIAENLSIQTNNPRILENFYEDQLRKTGRIPPSIRKAALAGQSQVIQKIEKEDAQKYSIELAQGLLAAKSAKNPEEYIAAKTEMQSDIARGELSPSLLMQQISIGAKDNLFDLDAARRTADEKTKTELTTRIQQAQKDELKFHTEYAATLAMTGNSVRAFQILEDLTKRFGINSDGSANLEYLAAIEQARQNVITQTNAYKTRVTTEEQSKVTQANSMSNELTSVIKKMFDSDPRMLKDFEIQGMPYLRELYSTIGDRIPGMQGLQYDENALPVNDPYLSTAFATDQALLATELISRVNVANKKEFEDQLWNNVSKASANAHKDPISAVNVVTNALDYFSKLTPAEQAKAQSKLDDIVSNTFVNAAQLVATNQLKPQDALRLYYTLSSNLEGKVQFGASVGESKRVVVVALKKQLGDTITAEALNANPDFDPVVTLTTTLPVEQDQESGLFVPRQSTRQDRPSDDAYTVGKSLYFNYLASTGAFTQQEIDKAESLGSFESLLRTDNPARNDLINLVIDSYNETVVSKVKSSGLSTSAEYLRELQQRGIPLNEADNNKLRFSSQQLDGVVSIQQSGIWNSLGYSAEKVTELMTNPDPSLENQRTNLFVRVAQSDIKRLNGQPVNSVLLDYHINNLRSEDPIKMQLGLIAIATYGGFRNPGIRAALNSGKLKKEDAAVIAIIQSKMTAVSPGVYSLETPKGVTIPAMVESIRNASYTAERTEIKDSVVAEEMGFENGIIASDKMLSTFKQIFNTARVYDSKNPAPVAKALLNAMGYVIEERANGQGRIIPDVMSTYTEFDERSDEITRIFKATIPENLRQDYADFFGRSVDENWTTIGDLIALKLDIDPARLWDLKWGYSYDSANSSLYMDRALGDFTARSSFALGGHLMWKDDDGKWHAVYGTDPTTKGSTPVRFNPRFTAQFPLTTAKEIRDQAGAPFGSFLMRPGEGTKSAFNYTINATLGIPFSYFGSKFANAFGVQEGNIQGKPAIGYRQMFESAKTELIPAQ